MPRSVAAISPTLAARIARTDSERCEIGDTHNTPFARTSSLARSQQFVQCNELTLDDAKRVFDGHHTIALSVKFAAAQVIIAATLPRERANGTTTIVDIPKPPKMRSNTRHVNVPPPPEAGSENEDENEEEDEEKSELVQVDENSVVQPEKPLVDERFGAFAIVAPATANVPRRESDCSDGELLNDRTARRSTLTKVFVRSRSWKRGGPLNDAADKTRESSNLQGSRRRVWCF